MALVVQPKDESKMEDSGLNEEQQLVKMKEISFSENEAFSHENRLLDLYADLNNFTGYNHLMSIQEVAVRH